MTRRALGAAWLAGLTRMPFGRFLILDSVGCLVWAGAFILIGYASGVRLEVMQQSLRVVSVAAQSLIVELEEDPTVRLTTNIVRCEPDDVDIGMGVEVEFVPWEEFFLPCFRPVGKG